MSCIFRFIFILNFDISIVLFGYVMILNEIVKDRSIGCQCLVLGPDSGEEPYDVRVSHADYGPFEKGCDSIIGTLLVVGKFYCTNSFHLTVSLLSMMTLPWICLYKLRQKLQK